MQLNTQEFKDFIYKKMAPTDYKLGFITRNIYDKATRTFDGSIGLRYNRHIRNINFDLIYNCPRYGHDTSNTYMSKLDNLFTHNILPDKFSTPGGKQAIANKDWTHLWELLKVSSHRASVFNVYTYSAILQELFDPGVLYTPVLAWNAYQMSFHNTPGYHTYIGTDVIPSVVNNATTMAQLPAYNLFGESTVEVYCTPSQNLALPQWHNKVDTILFSPPYYDLECYQSDNQSIDSYKTFDEWLNGYWIGTIQHCYNMLKPGGKLGFVVGNYKSKHGHGENLSCTMAEAAATILGTPEQHYIEWNKNQGMSPSKKTRNGNREDLWLYKKVLCAKPSRV